MQMTPEAVNNRNPETNSAGSLADVTFTVPMSGQKEVVACCAKNCPNFSLIPFGASGPPLLHSFPRWGSSRYKLWVGLVGVSPLPAVPKLCMLHFTPDQYKRTGIGNHTHTLMYGTHSRPKKLKKNALPSLFFDSDGECFEMVPVKIPEYSDEDPVEVTLNSCSRGFRSVHKEGQRDTQSSGSFPIARNNIETEENNACQLHHSVIVNQSGGQQHNSVDNGISKTDAAASGTLTGEKIRDVGNPPRNIGIGAHGCNFCGVSFSSHLNLGSHLRVHRSLSLKCRSCGLQLPNHWKLNQHLKVHGQLFPKSKASIVTSVTNQEHLLGKLFECKDCNRRFESAFWLAMHAQVHLPSWQKAQERALLRRKEFTGARTTNQPVTTILQGSLSVLTQYPLFQSTEVLINEISGKTKKPQFSAQSSSELNYSDYSSTNFPEKRLKVFIGKTCPKDYKFSLPLEPLAQNSWTAESSNLCALESRPETLLKISISDPCHNTKTSDGTEMGFVKKVYLCQQNNTTGMSKKKKVETCKSHTDITVPPKDQGHSELQQSPLTALNKICVHPANQLQFSLKARRCWDCGGRFTWPHSLALHRRKRHRRLSSSKHVCQCGQSFCNRLNLFHHELGHVRSCCYICCLCGVSFKKFAKLVKHWQRHRGNGPLLKCICGLTFKRVGNFVWHLLRNKP